MSSSTAVIVMAAKKTEKIEVRAEPEWIARVKDAATRLGLSASAYARMVITQRMDADSIPSKHGRKPRDG